MRHHGPLCSVIILALIISARGQFGQPGQRVQSGQRLQSSRKASSLNLPQVSKKLCKNEYDDLGVCVSELECESTRGLTIGVCSSDSGASPASGGNSNVCCLHLHCNVPQLSNEDQQLLLNHGLRTSRDLRSKMGLDPENVQFINPVLPAKSENCGMRDMNKDSQELKWNRQNQFNRDEQLINGTPARFDTKYPWMLALWIKFKTMSVPTCGAGLISSRFVITAAHCVADERLSYVLRGGSIINKIFKGPENGIASGILNPVPGDREGGGFVLEIDSITTHPKYQPFTFENDIALIKLKKKIRPSRELFPVCLPPPVHVHEKVTDYSGENVTVTGWGCEHEDCGLKDVPVVLREAVIPIIPNDIGMCWFMNDSVKGGGREYIPSRVFIIGGDESGSVATCNGDSGSPVVRKRPVLAGSKVSPNFDRWEVIGLVSWSKGCGRPLRPCVWTRVESYVDWILSQMRE